MKAKDKLPTNAAPNIAAFCPFEDALLFLTTCLISSTIDQNINKIVKALAVALIMLIMSPICVGSVAKIEKKAPII